MVEKGEKERDHAEIPAIDADRFLIAFNAAARASVAKEWRWQLAVMNVDNGTTLGRCLWRETNFSYLMTAIP